MITDISGDFRIVLYQAVNAIVVVAVILTAQTDFIRCNSFTAGFAGHVIDSIFTGSTTTCVAAECTGRGHSLDFAVIQHGFRRNGDNACLGIHGNTFRQVGAFPFATGRVFIHHDFMVCLAFVFIGDSQFVRTGGRGHGDAALFGSCGNIRRLRSNRRHVGDGASACGRSGLIRCCGIQRQGFVAFSLVVGHRRHFNLYAFVAARRDGRTEFAVGIRGDFCPGIAAVGAYFYRFAGVGTQGRRAVFQGQFHRGVRLRGIQRYFVDQRLAFFRLRRAHALHLRRCRRRGGRVVDRRRHAGVVAQLRPFRLTQGQAVGFFAFGLFVIHGVQLELYFGFARRYGQRFVDFRCRAEVGIAGLAVFQGDGHGDVFVRRFVQRDFVGRAVAFGDVFVAADADFRFYRLCVRIVFAGGAFAFRGFATAAVFCNDVALVFHRIRRQGHFARFRIDGDVFVRQGTFRLPFARRRVFDHGDGLRLVAFVGVFDFQFVRPVGRGDHHAAFVIRVLVHSRRRRGIAINDLGINAGFCTQLGSLRVADAEVVVFRPFKLAVFGRFQGDFRLGFARLDGQGLGRIRCRGEVGVFCTFVRQGDGDGDVFVRRFVQLDGVGRRFAFVDFVAAADGNDRLVWLRRVRIGVVAISLAARRDAAVRADVVSRRHIRAVFDVFRWQGHFAGLRINGDVFARQLAFWLPFARRRVFDYGDGLRLVAFVGVFDLQFVRPVGRGDHHAALVVGILCNSRRRRFATGHVVVNDRAFANHGVGLGRRLAFQADGFVTFHCRVVNRRHLNFDAVRAARRYGDFEVAVGIWRDFRPGVATVGAHFDFFAKVSRHIATTVR